MSFFLTGLRHILSFVLIEGGRNFEWRGGETPLSNWLWPVRGMLIYLAMVILLKKLITKPMAIPSFLPAAHNMILCVGSAIMFLGCASAVAEMYMERHSLDFFFCTPIGVARSGRLFFWSYVYYISKFYEFIDTVFLLLKAKSTSFLHVFHHALVVFMAWLWVEQAQTLQWVGLLTNTAVHVVMYFYYFETTQGRSPWWKRYITSFQIAQFASSFVTLIPFALYQWIWRKETGGCEGLRALGFNAGFNFCLLVLFWQFYSTAYAKRKEINLKKA